MDENLHKDNLEQFFRKSFEGQKNMPPEDDWDIPSNNIWEGISSNILKGQPKVYFFQNWRYWAVTVAALLMIVFYQFWTYQHGFAHFSEQLTEQVEKVEILTKELEKEHARIESLEEIVKENNRGDNSNELIESGVQLADNEFVVQGSGGSNFIKKKTERQPKANFNKNFKPNTKETGTNETNQLLNPPIAQGEMELSTFPQNDSQSQRIIKNEHSEIPIIVDNIERLANENSFVNFENKKVLKIPTLNDFNKNHALFSYQKWSFTAHASPVFAKRVIRNKVIGFVRPIGESEETKSSFELGLDVNYHVNKNWSIFGGVSYQKLNLFAQNRVRFKYTEVDATPNNQGHLVKDYELDLNTSFGDLEVDMRMANDLQNDGLDYEEGEKITARIRSNLHLENIGLVVGVGRNFDFKRWSFGIKAAVVPTLNISNDLAINRIRFPDQRLILERAEIRVNKFSNFIQKATLDAQVGIGVYCKVTPKIQIGIEPTYRTNLTPFFKNNRIESSVSSLAVHTGVTYHF